MNNVPKPSKRSGRMSVLLERIKAGLLGEVIPSPPSNAGKRIVSKREYAVQVSRRTALRWGSVGLAVFVAMCFFCILGFVLGGLLVDAIIWKVLCFFIAALFLPIAWIVKRVAERAMQEAMLELNIVPLTRANIADLPVPDSLVRALQEPMQAQETMLLRASTAGQEQHEEQLLRAAAGEQEQA